MIDYYHDPSGGNIPITVEYRFHIRNDGTPYNFICREMASGVWNPSGASSKQPTTLLKTGRELSKKEYGVPRQVLGMKIVNIPDPSHYSQFMRVFHYL